MTEPVSELPDSELADSEDSRADSEVPASERPGLEMSGSAFDIPPFQRANAPNFKWGNKDGADFGKEIQDAYQEITQ